MQILYVLVELIPSFTKEETLNISAEKLFMNSFPREISTQEHILKFCS